MGVSNYFIWLARRYKDVILYPRIESPPDVLYLDLNCAIHPAVKSNPTFTLEQMYQAVIVYIEDIINFTKPNQLVYIAIDGVAPKAKMEQQRCRRYKSVQERKDLQQLKITHKVKSSEPESVFDFNMISPGTKFMAELSICIQKWIKKQPYAIIFSDASEVGEGEHKIMHHIRMNQPASVCVYGLDADLIFLSLINCPIATETTILRETVNFEKDLEITDGKYTYLSINSLRNCLTSILNPFTTLIALEQNNIKDIFGITDDAEAGLKQNYQGTPEENTRLVLDYTFMCFMIGNDFLPSIPSLKIKDGGLETLILAYKQTAWETGGYLIKEDKKTIDCYFFQILLRHLSDIEEEFLKKSTINRKHRVERFLEKLEDLFDYDRAVESYKYIEHDEDVNPDRIRLGFDGWRNRYYKHLMHISTRTPQEYRKHIEEICFEYFKGLRWVLHYYQEECVDWRWSYKYHAAPSISDLLNYHISTATSGNTINTINFTPSVPVNPHVQLMAILPPESSHLLPSNVARLINSHDSPIHYMYPIKFKLQKFLNRYRWECHPILPPINLELLEKYYLQSTN